MLVTIFSYNRPEMLEAIVEQFEGQEDVWFHIIDDGSDLVPQSRWQHIWDENITQFDHGGKEKFWEKFKYGIEEALDSVHDNFIFMPDDFLDIDLHKISAIHDAWEETTYSVNIINDGREECWGRHKEGHEPVDFFDTKLVEVGFNDCGFITNRKTLSLINIEPVTPDWFDRPEKSSGVGFQLTKQLRRNKVPMFKPLKSLAYHGVHESKMHPEHRKWLNLKSI